MKCQFSEKNDQGDRVFGLDFLRGLFVVMAVFEHYCGYFNFWYVDFFHREMPFWDTIYASHRDMAGVALPIDHLSATLFVYFIPWVSQIYLALAAFNLSRRPQAEFASDLNKKLMVFGGAYIALLVESFITAPSFGEAISFYPVMLWMLLLALFSMIYARFGIMGMLLFTPLAVMSAFGTDESLFTMIQSWGQSNIHDDFEIDSYFNQFMLSGCLGFIYGWFWHHNQKIKDVINYRVFIVSACALAAYLIWGDSPSIDVHDVYANEHEMSTSMINYLGVLGMEFLVMSLVLILHQTNISLKWKPINWIGVYSLPIFLLHKVIFVHFWGPLLLIITAWANSQLFQNFWLVASLTLLTIAAIYGVERSGAISLPFGRQCRKNWQAHYNADERAEAVDPALWHNKNS